MKLRELIKILKSYQKKYENPEVLVSETDLFNPNNASKIVSINNNWVFPFTKEWDLCPPSTSTYPKCARKDIILIRSERLINHIPVPVNYNTANNDVIGINLGPE